MRKKTMQADSLAGKCLIASPMMNDGYFARSVVYICAHDEEGALGLIINKVNRIVGFSELVERLGVEGKREDAILLYDGGPLEKHRGFVLHSTDYQGKDTAYYPDSDLAMTTTTDIIQDIIDDKGPENFLVTVGYASWGSQQLEAELCQNSWLYSTASLDIIFKIPHNERWEYAFTEMGLSLSSMLHHQGIS